MKRERLEDDSEPQGGGRYFSGPSAVETFSTGCKLLDMVTGGYPRGRMVNIVGDASAGKSLLAIEGFANFAQEFPKADLHYAEAESAFDKPYAESLGLPLKRVRFVAEERVLDTVEDFFDDVDAVCKKKRQAFYVLDSLDSLTTRADKAHLMKVRKAHDAGEDSKGSYGVDKAKIMSQRLRDLVRPMEKAGVTLLIISQVRDKIGFTMGEKHTRAGGRALEFYSSWVLWLAKLQKLKQTRKGVERPVGIMIKAQCKKNKITIPYRECQFPIRFTYGVDDMQAAVDWLRSVKRADLAEKATRGIELAKMDDSQHERAKERLSKYVEREWREIEKRFMPKRKKYSN